jgi:hypothetical protein
MRFPGMLMRRVRVFPSFLMFSFAMVLRRSAMRFRGIFVMGSGFLMCVLRHDDLLGFWSALQKLRPLSAPVQ